ncbi:MAG: hypothetical protein ING02_17720 [Roseomonas sp.]|nr:hypothetical protein [Roseomonas sp.]
MRGDVAVTGSLASYIDLEKWVRPDHSLLIICGSVKIALVDLSSAFGAIYSLFGQVSSPLGRLLRAQPMQAV